jgi:hypothetical protein
MRHRIFYLFPDIPSARRALDDLLLSRIEERHIHFLTNGAPLPDDMPEANILHKTDVVHGAESGMMMGAVLGVALGAALVNFYDASPVIAILAALVGLAFGGWAASMVAAALPNTRLNAFYPELERGKILLIADVPATRVAEIEKMLAERHPETRFGGEDSHIPIFP